MKNGNDLSDKLQAVLRPHLKFLEPGAPIPADATLGTLGLDSMATINFLLDFETTFGVQVPDDLLSAEMFETLATLEATVLPLLSPRAD
jgi:acyl carrier protein